MKWKVCGLKNATNMQEVCSLRPDAIGMIFYEKSPRFIGEIPLIPTLKDNQLIERVGVFVNAPLDYIQQSASVHQLNTIQLHGHETVEEVKYLKALDFQVWKVFHVSEDFDFSQLKIFDQYCDAFLFDTKSPAYGGTGEVFDWAALDNYHGNTPFWLSGGIGLHNARKAVSLKHPKLIGIDVNSRFEITPGNKDIAQLTVLEQLITEKNK